MGLNERIIHVQVVSLPLHRIQGITKDMIFRRRKVDTFKEKFPDYPVKPVPLSQTASIWAQGLLTGAALIAAALLLLFGLSKVEVPRPFMAGPEPEKPMTEEEMFKSLSAEQLHPIGQTCADNQDLECAKTVYSRILELKPDDLLALGSLAVAEASLGFTRDAEARMRLFAEKGGHSQLKKSKVSRFIKEYQSRPD